MKSARQSKITLSQCPSPALRGKLCPESDLAEAVELRYASEDDVPTIEQISTGSISGKQPFVLESFSRRTIIGAYASKRLVGFVIWDKAFFGRPFVWLLGVDPAFRRRGLASTLMRAFEMHHAGESLFTSTNASNHAMQRLLAQIGFVESGRVDNLDPGDPEIFYFRLAPSTHA